MERRMKKCIQESDDIIFTGSITVFLTILFLLFFSLVGVAFENVRILSSAGYMRVAAHSAAMTVFGEYNRELYKDYGLFAYGGCNGSGTETLAEEFTGVLIENTRSRPEKVQTGYGNLYGLQEMVGFVLDVDMLTDSEVFLQQIVAYLKSSAVEDLTDKIRSKTLGEPKEKCMQEKLTLTKEYEEGKFNISTKQGAAGKKLLGRKNALKQDTANGNPLEIFTDMMRDGVLNLVCDAKDLSDGVIEQSATSDKELNSVSDKQDADKMGAADYLRGLIVEDETKEDLLNEGEQTQKTTGLEGEESAQDKNIFEKGADKAKYICYAARQFSNFIEDKNRTTKYGLEYLAAGKEKEKENLSCIVNKLLRIRLLLNFGCIVTDRVLEEKSFVTATILAGFTGMPPVIRAVQYTILLILAFEEACVEVTALLEGRRVPAVKRARDLKVRYEEICLASKKLFASKAKEYSKDGKTSVTDLTYQEYLWLILLGQSEKDLRNRCFDLIQYDLREKYNQSFSIRTCICRSNYKVQYQLSFLFSELPFLNMQENSINIRELEVNYGYKSR